MKTVMELSNRKVVIPYAIGALALVVAFLLRVDEARYPALVAGLTPVRVALKASTNPDRASFTPIWSEPHYVAVVFPLRGAAPDTDAIVDRAQHAVGPNQDAMPAFDFGWRVLEEATVIQEWSSRQKPTGIFGGPNRGFIFGEFPAHAGHVYSVETFLGPDFDKFLAATPLLEVGVASASTSVGLAWGRDLYTPAVSIFGLVGVIALALGFIASKRPLDYPVVSACHNL